ncbi:MAG: FAD-binding oxidoreductase [Rhodobacteraceae bacterium]|nr:FAD-binding oxidoreductase [Paracoccaceae bacterium]
MAMAEIEVFGGGIFGLSVAYACLRRGVSVRLIEKRQIGAGASGGVVGALFPHMPDNWNDKKEFQFQSLIRGAEYWREVERLSGLASGYRTAGRLVALMDVREVALARMREISAREHWQGLADWRVQKAGQYPGWEMTSPTGFVVHDTLSALIAPAAACHALAGAIRALGGEIVEGETEGRGATASVYCTGYEGLADLSSAFGAEVGKGIKGQALTLGLDAGEVPQIYGDGLLIIPHVDGTVAVGSTSEVDWSSPDQTDDLLDALHERAITACPALRGASVLRRWAGIRPRGARRAPILGAWPGREGVFVANGGFKIGFGVAIMAGEVMADLILNGAADIPDSFSVAANLA